VNARPQLAADFLLADDGRPLVLFGSFALPVRTRTSEPGAVMPLQGRQITGDIATPHRVIAAAVKNEGEGAGPRSGGCVTFGNEESARGLFS